MIRYLQTHPIAQTSSLIKIDDFDSTAELWFDSLEGLEKVLGSDFYQQRVYPDELTFLDHERTQVTIGYQDNIMGDQTELKP